MPAPDLIEFASRLKNSDKAGQSALPRNPSRTESRRRELPPDSHPDRRARCIGSPGSQDFAQLQSLPGPRGELGGRQ